MNAPASANLQPIETAPKDREFDAILAETGERVTVRYSHQHAYWAGQDWFYDVNGDGGPHWPAKDFAGWLPESVNAAA